MKNIQDEILSSNVSYHYMDNIIVFIMITETTRIENGETVTTGHVTEAVKYYINIHINR